MAIGAASFFWAAPKAQNPESYEKTIATLDSLGNKALVPIALAAIGISIFVKGGKGKVVDGVVEFQNSMNKMIEGVAVMIVTTCIIPFCVLILFLWIVKNVTGLNITVSSLKKLPKASRLLKKPDEKIDAEV